MNKIGIIISLILSSCVTHKLPSNKIVSINFNTESKSKLQCDLTFPNPVLNSELSELRTEYNLDALTNLANSDIERALILLNWTNGKWSHNPSNMPVKNDALNILKEAENGGEFRCVEYGIVLSAVLNSIGIPARILGIKTRDVETTKMGAGHVVTEAFIPDLNKWVFMDGQINYMPFLDNTPLNAVEYQDAIVNHKELIELRSINGKLDKKETRDKINWVAKYLYYFDIKFDSYEKKVNCKEKSHLMLVPINAKNPTVFQIHYKIDNCIYTNNIKDFYKEPSIK